MTAAVVQRVEIHPYVETIVDPTVQDVHRRWRDYVCLADLRQEAAVWWYGPGQPYVAEYLARDENHVRLRRSIWRWCARYAEQQKASAVGYEPSDQLRYSPAEIIGLLSIALDPDGVPEVRIVADGGSAPKGNLAEGSDVMASIVDVRRALAAVAEDDLHFLGLVEDLHQEWDRIAVYTETQPDSARRRHTRIAERMARWLNGNTEETP